MNDPRLVLERHVLYPSLIHLASPRRVLLERLCADLPQPESLAGLVRTVGVFGSVARGDATADSDMDVLVVVSEPLPDLHPIRQWSEAIFDLTGNHPHLVVVTVDEIRRGITGDHAPFFTVTLDELVVLYGSHPSEFIWDGTPAAVAATSGAA